MGHSVGEVWGLAMHPSLPIFLTAGDDCTVKCWNLQTQRLVSYFILPDKCRAIDIEPTEAASFSLALNSGAIWVVSTDILFGRRTSMIDINIDGIDVTHKLGLQPDGEPTPLPSVAAPPAAGAGADAAVPPPASVAGALFPPRIVTGPTQWVQALRYSFDGSLLCAGSHDQQLYLFDARNEYQLLHVLQGHSSFVTHFDFGLLLGSETGPVQEEERVTPEGVTEFTAQYVTTFDQFDKETMMIIPNKTTTTVISVTNTSTNVREVVDITTATEAAAPRKIAPKDMCLQSCSGAFELFFWTCDGARVHSASAMKDAWWSTLTCPLGWPVQGIWPIERDGTEVTAVARSHSWDKVPVLAAVDNFGRVRLYNYPCVTSGASDKCYKGHASNVTNVQFSYDDTYCVTLGGTDKCVFVWETDIQDEIRERAAYATSFGASSLITSGAATAAGVVAAAGGEAASAGGAGMNNSGGGGGLATVLEDEAMMMLDEPEPAQQEEDDGASYSVFKAAPPVGDQSGAIKPWKGAVREPSHWKEPENIGEEPDASLELRHVYGYRGWDCRNNVRFADSRFEIVYHVAGVGVVFNSKDNKQLHNTEHDDDILCLDVHPEGHTVATGEIGKFPKIVIWDANTGVTIRVLHFHKRGVANVAFSANGELLVSTGMDDDRTVVVHNVLTGAVLGKGKAGRGVDLYTLSVGGNELFVTGGKNHVKFWELPQANSPGGELSSKSGIYNLKAIKGRTVVSSAFLGADPVTGMQDGYLLLWKDRTNTKFSKAHNGPVTTMFTISNDSPGIDTRELGPRVITGGKDGFVHIWDLQLQKKWSLNMHETSPLSACPQIQAVATKENRLLISTQASEIYEVSLLSNAEVYRHVQGHYATRAEVWGLAAHPSAQRFVTCGDDMTVRLWDAKTLQQAAIVQVGVKVRAVAIHPDGSQIAVATYEGKVLVLSSDLVKEEAQVTVSNSWIEAMAYSPDGKMLAVGSHDNVIYLLETRAYSCKLKCKGHHSYITALDFSADNAVLQSISGDYELLFWSCATGKQIVSPTEVRDAKWATFTCKLGWPVQGIWPPNADGTDVNSVDRSPDGNYLVSGDDFSHVKLFRCPCTKEKSKFKAYKGHAEHVMKVRFSFDGKYVFSVGGLDKAILQYEFKRDHGSKANKASSMKVTKSM
jgi:echinoderm microtubule-associated protein-like 6